MALPDRDPPRLLTAEDLYAIPDDDRRYELVRGELRVSEPPGWGHGVIAIRLGARLGAYVEKHRLGYVTGETGYVLERGPDTVRGPDVAFIGARRRPAPDVEHKYFEGAPDLVAEVLSPDDRPSEVAERVANFLGRGTRVVWVINPKARTATVHAPGQAARLLRDTDTLDGGDVVPGFTCAVAELFPEPPNIH